MDPSIVLDVIFSSSSSDDEELPKVLPPPNILYKEVPREKNYVEDIVPRYSPEEFISHFRLHPDTFSNVLELVMPKLSSGIGRRPITPEKQVLMAIWMMATPDSYRSVSAKFGVGRATAHRSLKRVVTALTSLAPKYISWPRGTRAAEVVDGFNRMYQFPGVIGVIDGRHMLIRPPKHEAKSFVNKKGKHSILVQATSDHDLLFTSIVTENPGSVSEAEALRTSDIMGYMEDSENYFPGDAHLIGDGAYPLRTNLMVPFKDTGNLEPREKNFNCRLASVRKAIQGTCAQWKNRWRSLQASLLMTKIEDIPDYLLATAVLHNLCILMGDVLDCPPPTTYVEEEEDDMGGNEGNVTIDDEQKSLAAQMKREQIMNSLTFKNDDNESLS